MPCGSTLGPWWQIAAARLGAWITESHRHRPELSAVQKLFPTDAKPGTQRFTAFVLPRNSGFVDFSARRVSNHQHLCQSTYRQNRFR